MTQYDPLNFGRQHGLGNHIATYRPYTVLRKIRDVCLAIVIFDAVVFVVFSLALLNSSFPILMGLGSTLLGIVVFSLFWLLVGLLARILPSCFKQRQQVLVYDYGLVYIKSQRKSLVIRRQDIRVWCYTAGYDNHPKSPSHLKVSSTSGDHFTLTVAFWNVGPLGKTLLSQRAIDHISGIWNTYQTTQHIAFDGGLTVIPQGLQYRDTIILWNEIKSMTISIIWVVVKKQGKRLTWASVYVPNGELFRMLIHRISGKDYGLS